MGALAQLSNSTVDVEPGRSETIAITVRNTGEVVDRFQFEALGQAAPWVTFSPTSLSLFPGASGAVNVVLSPPREPTLQAGPTPLGVRVVSSEDPAGSVVEEATVDVGEFSDISLELLPRVTRGRFGARTQLAVDNRSNCRYRAELTGSDPQQLLAVSFRPSIVNVDPGNAEFVKVRIRPDRRFWRGPERTRTFRVTLRNQGRDVSAVTRAPGDFSADGAGPADNGSGQSAPDPRSATGGMTAGSSQPVGSLAVLERPTTAPSPHADEIVVEGSMLQGPMLPRWLLAAAGAIVALAALLAILWFALLKPHIHSTAQNEVQTQLAASGITPVSTGGSPKTSSPKTSAGSAPSGGGGAGARTGGAGGAPTGAAVSSGAGTATGTAGGATVSGSAQATGNGTKVVYSVPQGSSLEVTDILVENTAGDTGTLTLASNGTAVMQWAMANFRDLDYHWITPTVFGPGTQMQLIVSGCSGACTPGLYYAGHLASG
jgi:hypothetical protein